MVPRMWDASGLILFPILFYMKPLVHLFASSGFGIISMLIISSSTSQPGTGEAVHVLTQMSGGCSDLGGVKQTLAQS